jgi:hypothetical protein
MSSEKQITAVEWLNQKLTNRQNGIFDGLPHLSVAETYAKAKEMQQEQAQQYAQFVVACIDRGLKPILFNDWINLK